MKANGAPTKIYIHVVDDGEEIWHYATRKRENVDNVEYTRTDAFIEKAVKFFTEKFEVEDYNDNIDIDGSPIFNYGRFIDDFKNYIKGE